MRRLDDLSGPWMLFVDDHVVAKRINVTRTPHAFEKYKHNPVLEDGYLCGTVLPTENGSGYRMWYTQYWKQDHYRIRYATSDNGLLWKDGGLVLPNNNNAIPSVIHTPDDPQRCYKMICNQYGPRMVLMSRGLLGRVFIGRYSMDVGEQRPYFGMVWRRRRQLLLRFCRKLRRLF